jgi:PIN domain nuclease of toxin-antitoxin system
MRAPLHPTPTLASILPRRSQAVAVAAAAAVAGLLALAAAPAAEAQLAICERVSPPPSYCYEEEPPAVPKPPAPSDFIATSSTGDSVSLAWTDNAADEYGYTVSRYVNGFWTAVAHLPAGAGTGGRMTYTDTGLEAGRSYTYRLRLSNAGGSTYSSSLTASTVAKPPAPSDFVATASTSSSISLAWTDNATDEYGYTVSRYVNGSWSPVAHLPAGAGMGGRITHTDTGLEADRPYTYRLELSNVAGTTYSASLTASTGMPPAPSDFVATTSTSSSISLAWTDNAADEYGYTVSRYADGYWTAVAHLPASAGTGGRKTYTDTGLNADRSYTYRLELSNIAGTSYSSSVTASTHPAGVAAVLSARNATTRSVDLSWSAATSTTQYVVERRLSGGTFAEVALLDAAARTHTDRGLEPNTSYEYRVRAIGAPAVYEFSNIASARTLASQVTRVSLSPSSTELFRYGGDSGFFIPADAEILAVRNVAVDELGGGLMMARVEHRDSSFETRSVDNLAFGATTGAFNGQLLKGSWTVRVTNVSALYLFDCMAFENPPGQCKPTARVALEVTWA